MIQIKINDKLFGKTILNLDVHNSQEMKRGKWWHSLVSKNTVLPFLETF